MVSNPAFTRTNAWNNGGNFNNPDLLWYARGVGVMQSRALNDPNSWWFFAAIHGEYVTETGYPGWGSIPTPSGANDTGSISERSGPLLESVSAPKLVLPSMASWISGDTGSADPGGGGEPRWSFDLGFAVLELSRTG